MENATKLWYLQNFNLFASLPTEEMKAISEKVVDSIIPKGEYIYFRDEPSHSLYFLKKGGVKIASVSEAGRESILAVLQPGEIFGELALAGASNREDFAVSLEDGTVICAMPVQDLEELMARHPTVTMKVTRLLGLRLLKMERKVRDLVFKDARTRIVDFIREMAIENGKQVGDEILIKHIFTHQDIASLTATSRQVVTTVLNELRGENLINFERKRILVGDMKRLK